MAPLDVRKNERKQALVDHKAEQAAMAEHIANAVNEKRDPNSELRNPPLQLPRIQPLLSQKLSRVKHAQVTPDVPRFQSDPAAAKSKVDQMIADKVATNALNKASKPAPVWNPNSPPAKD